MDSADGFAAGHVPAGVPADADLEAELELVVIRKVIPAKCCRTTSPALPTGSRSHSINKKCCMPSRPQHVRAALLMALKGSPA